MSARIAAGAVDALGAAFLSGDADVVLEHFASTGDPIYAGSEPGEVAAGRDALRALLEDLFARGERYSWQTTGVIATGGDDVVHLVAEADLFVHASGAVTQQVPYRITGVLEAEPTGWRWRLCQGSEPTPA